MKFRIPHVFALLFLMIIFCAAVSYIVPSGQFERKEKQVGHLTKTVVQPGTYKNLPKSISLKGLLLSEDRVEGKAQPVSLMQVLTAIPRGMERSADIIFFIFIVGGVISILQRSGVIVASIHAVLNRFEHAGPWVIGLIMVLLATAASTLGMGEEFIPLVPIFLMISKRLGYDRIFGLAIVVIAAEVGFAAATTNPFTVGIAQGIAELEMGSGMFFRVVFAVICLAFAISYVLWYGRKVKKDPSKSLMPDDTFHDEDHGHEEHIHFTRQHGLILLTGIPLFGLIIYGTQKLGWYMAELGGGFILIGIITAVIARMSINETARAAVKGMEEMVVAALVVGFARGIEVVMLDGQILDSLINHASDTLTKVPAIISVQGMLIFQTTLNFLIPSGSGQAAVTMPIMTPLADLIGITRQTAVFAFTCGDGFSNSIIPTSGFLMAMLALAKVPYTKWLRFMLPLFIVLFVLSMIFLSIAVFINYQ